MSENPRNNAQNQEKKSDSSLGKFVREKRRSLGFQSRRQLAEAMAKHGDFVDTNYLGQIENGAIDIPRQPRLGQ